MNELTLFLVLLLLAALCRPLTVLLHELGHAIPILLLTRSERVELFVGTHGEPQRSWRLPLGRLQVYLHYNPWLHLGGLTRYDRMPDRRQARLFIILGGPLASLLIAALALWSSFMFSFHPLILGLSILFLAGAIFDFVVNLIPQRQPLELPDGSCIDNDGQQLWQILMGD